MRRRAAALGACVGLAAGHGTMVVPPPRNAGRNASVGGGAAPGCENNACMWFNQGCTIGCPCSGDVDYRNFSRLQCDNGTLQKPTLPDMYRTWAGSSPTRDAPGDMTRYHPWRAPGSSRALDPCGLSNGAYVHNDAAGARGMCGGTECPDGYRGSGLPPAAARTVWRAGAAEEVAWAMVANHGGGYQYRLCPRGRERDEACFEETPLAFAGAAHVLRWANGTERRIPAARVSEGTFPPGSQWTRLPVPACNSSDGGIIGEGCDQAQFPPPEGCDPSCWGYEPRWWHMHLYPFEPCFESCHTTEIPSIVDRVLVPADLPAGEYVVQWRWDCEQTPQVWSGCGDVTVAAY